MILPGKGQADGIRSIEAQIMDYADDIAYSVHDLEDFHRIRAVPWHLLRVSQTPDPASQLGDMIQSALDDWYDRPSNAQTLLEAAANSIMKRTEAFPQIYLEPYEGTKEQRISLRNWTSDLIRRFISELRPTVVLDAGVATLRLHPEADAEVRLLKRITRAFVIDGPTIGAQQRGQRRIVKEVFSVFFDDISTAIQRSRAPRIVPKRFHYLASEREAGASEARLTADSIASLTENELVALYQRLIGNVGGSITDPIIR